MKGTSSSRHPRAVLIVLALVFLAPVVIAWWMHSVAQWRPAETINHGVLVTPLRRLDTTRPLITPAGLPLRSHYLEGKWTLVYISGPSCDSMCTQKFYAMRQVTIAQGENMRRVQRLFIMIAGHDSLPAITREYPQMDVAMFSTSDKEAFLAPFLVDAAESINGGRIYLVDPLGNLMMYYDPGSKPGGILKDLRRLLKVSSFG